MDTEERHELKENELAAFIAGIGPWWSKYGTRLLLVVFVIVAMFAGYRIVKSRTAGTHENAWIDWARSTSPEAFRAVALDHKNPAVRILAFRNGADLLLDKTRLPLRPNETPEDRDADLADAASMYQQMFDASDQTIYKLNALEGLANVAESRNRWDEADRYWRQLIDTAGSDYPLLASRARLRLNLLESLKEPVVFGPELDLSASESTLPEAPPWLTATPSAESSVAATQPAPAAE